MPHSAYKGKTRVRACGLLVQQNKLLLVQLKSPVSGKLIWTPPGGGVRFGESLNQALIREFKEETGLSVLSDKLIYINELVQSEFHAIEFYFRVSAMEGEPVLGTDPEHSASEQVLSNIGFFKKDEVQRKDVVPAFLKNEFWDIFETTGNRVFTGWVS